MTGGAFALSRTYNGYGETEAQSVGVAGQGIGSWNLAFDKTGRITSKTETVNGVAVNYDYTYDSIGRLLTVTRDGSLVEEYRYNANGSRIYEMNAQRGITGRDLTYSDEDHLLNAGGITYQYNSDGFLRARTDGQDVTTYDYSSRSELCSVTLPDGTFIEYVHDPLGRRIAKKVNGAMVEKYLWSGMTKLLAVYDGSGSLKMRFEYAGGRMPYAMTKNGSVYYLTYDQVGSLRAVADSSGNVVKRIDYDAFGNIMSDTNPSFEMPFGFAGGLHDRDTGLVRFGFRDYDSETGRWTGKDPILFAGGDTDLYGYCLNDPIHFIDRYGLVTEGDVISTIITVAITEASRAGIISPVLATTLSAVTLPIGDLISPNQITPSVEQRLMDKGEWNDIIYDDIKNEEMVKNLMKELEKLASA